MEHCENFYRPLDSVFVNKMASGVRDCNNVCQLCGSRDNLMLCSRCRSTWYCSKEHQKYDWKYHKLKCKTVNTANPIVQSESKHSMVREIPQQNIEEGIIQPLMATAISDTCPDIRDTCDVHRENNNIGKSNINEGSQSSPQSDSHSDISQKKDSSASNNSSDYDYDLFTETGSSESYILETDTYSLLSTDSASTSEMSPQNLLPNSDTSKQAYISACSVLESRKKTIAEYVIKCLNTYGVCVVDGFLGQSKGQQILDDVQGLHESGKFTRGQLVNSESSVNKLIRGDIITWVEGTEPGCANIHFLISAVDAIISTCNGKLDNYDISGRTKAMIACYPGCSTGYMKHVDNPNKDGRCITSIYYLNKNWDILKDGGVLRIYPEGQSRIASIEPKFDRLLFFWSDRRNPHEVMPSFNSRYAITVWYYDAEERSQAVKRFNRYKDKGKNNPKRIMVPLTMGSKHK